MADACQEQVEEAEKVDDEEGNGIDANCIEIAKFHCVCETAQVAMTVEMM